MKKKQPIIVIDETRQEVFLRGKEVRLTPKEYAVLLALVRSNVTENRAGLVKSIWKSNKKVNARIIDTHVARLRSKLGKPGLIRTVTHVGYKFME